MIQTDKRNDRFFKGNFILYNTQKQFVYIRPFSDFQALMPFAASPTFGLLYRSTVADFPQAFLFLIIGVYLLVALLTYIVHWLGNKAEKLRQAEEGDTNEK